MSRFGIPSAAVGATVAAIMFAAAPAAAEAIKIATLKVAGGAPLFLADDRGYFKAEGLDVEFVYFDAGQPTALAVVAGSADIGVAAFGAGIYALAGQGGLRVIAGQSHEVPGFRTATYVASNGAYDAGLKSLSDIKGHSVAMTVAGGPFHYALGLLADKYGFDMSSLTLRPMQSLANNISAVIGGQVDVAIAPFVMVQGAIAKDQVKLLGYAGDVTPWQISGVFVTKKTADDRRDMIERFLRAYRKGLHDTYDAFTDENGHRKNMATADDVLAVMSKYLGAPPQILTNAVEYVDRDGRLDEKDIARQIAWFKSQNLLKVDVPLDTVIDARYAVALPDQ
jgi:NitT/TauT family transport system substrate-binding protein